MPSMPPTTLVSNEVIENELAPHREGTYPPAREPIIIPNVIIFFLDMIVSKISVHFNALPRSSKSLKLNYFNHICFLKHRVCSFFAFAEFSVQSKINDYTPSLLARFSRMYKFQSTKSKDYVCAN